MPDDWFREQAVAEAKQQYNKELAWPHGHPFKPPFGPDSIGLSSGPAARWLVHWFREANIGASPIVGRKTQGHAKTKRHIKFS
jgi:hypothetical protein